MARSSSLAVQMQKLNSTQQREVSDFIEFLLSRRVSHKRVGRKARLTKVSVWSEDDIRPVEEAIKESYQGGGRV